MRLESQGCAHATAKKVVGVGLYSGVFHSLSAAHLRNSAVCISCLGSWVNRTNLVGIISYFSRGFWACQGVRYSLSLCMSEGPQAVRTPASLEAPPEVGALSKGRSKQDPCAPSLSMSYSPPPHTPKRVFFGKARVELTPTHNLTKLPQLGSLHVIPSGCTDKF